MSGSRQQPAAEHTEGVSARGAWTSCFVDPWRGVAHFDGLTIEADPITSARPDKVLPCIADEQVFFCRMLAHQLAGQTRQALNAKRALDLGCGNGVLAIAGAALGLQVDAVDICDRALLFTGLNRDRNQTAIDAAGGRILSITKADALELLPEGSACAYDYIFLNPPFALVPQGYEAPRCVDGGVDGQQYFHHAVERCGALLKPGGQLFAVHLLYFEETGHAGSLQQFLAQPQQSGKWKGVDVYPALTTPTCPLADFLAAVRDVGGEQGSLSSSGQGSSTDGPSLCIAFVRMTRKGDGNADGAATVTMHPSDSVPVRPPVTWAERLRLHRVVLGPSAHARADDAREAGRQSLALSPAGDLFLTRTTPFLSRSSLENASIEDRLHQWIADNRLIATAHADTAKSVGAPFDVLMVEAAPWYLAALEGTRRSSLGLSSTTILLSRESDGSPADCRAQALHGIQRAITEINRSQRSVFRHSDQAGAASAHWHMAAQRSLRVEASCDSEECSGTVVQASTPPPSAPTQEEPAPERALEARHGVGAIVSKRVLDALGVPEQNPARQGSFDDCVDAALRDFTSALVTCRVLHAGDSPVTCYFVGIPIPATRGLVSGGGAENEKLTGMAYAYGWSRQDWSAETEETLLDVGRLAALMYEEEFSDSLEKEVRRLEKQRGSEVGRREIRQYSQHELSYLIHVVQPGLPERTARFLHNYFGVVLGTDEGANFRLGTPRDDSEFANRIKEMWKNGYVARKLGNQPLNNTSGESLIPALDERVEEFEEEACKFFRLEGSLDCACLVGKPDSHVAAFGNAVLAALSNAAKHLLKKKNESGLVDISMKTALDERKAVVVTSIYRLDSSDAVLKAIETSQDLATKKWDSNEGTAVLIDAQVGTYYSRPKNQPIFDFRVSPDDALVMQSETWIHLP